MLDDTDRRLLQALQGDPRASYSTLSREIGVDSSTVRRRLEAMLASGAIDIFVASEPRSLGETSHHLIQVDVDPKAVMNAAARLVETDGVIYVGIGTGDPAIWLSVIMAPDDFRSFIVDVLPAIAGVRGYRTNEVLNVMKRWPPWHAGGLAKPDETTRSER